LRTKYI